MSGAGLRELSDPQIATYPSGNALDRFVLSPGGDIWGSLLSCPSGRTLEEGNLTLNDHVFPAEVLPPQPLSLHHPVHLDLPFAEVPQQRSG